MMGETESKTNWRGGPSLKPRSLTPGDEPAAPDIQKIEPLPPEQIPVKGPSLDLPPKDYRGYIMRERIEKLKEKTLIRRRPLLTMAFTVIAFILSRFMGIEADIGTYIDVADGLQLGELIIGTGCIIAAYFWDRGDDKDKPKDK